MSLSPNTAESFDWLAVVSPIATMLSIAMFSAPIPEMRAFERQRHVQQRPFLPTLTLVLNCAIWLIYGWLTYTVPVMLTNGYGLLCSLYYASVFLRFDEIKERAKNRQLLAGVGALVGVVLVGSVIDHVAATPLVGLLASGFSIAVFASPLAQLAHIVKVRSVASLSFPFALASTLSASLWTAFGYLAHDGNIYVPNFIAFLLSASQLALFAMFSSSSAANSKLAPHEDV